MRTKKILLALAGATAMVGASTAPALAYDFWCYEGAKPCGPGFDQCRKECAARTGTGDYCYNVNGEKGNIKCSR